MVTLRNQASISS